MVARYFFTRFLQTMGLNYVVLLGLFLSCNIVVKLPLIAHPTILPVLATFLLPVMTIFALPLASSMAVFSVVAAHRDRDELVIISFLPRAMRALRCSVVLFGLLTAFCYALFALYLAPRGYALSKRLFFSVAKDQFLQVEPGVFHSTLPTMSFYVHSKKPVASGQTIFEKLVLVLRKKNKEQLLIAADSGFFDDQQLMLSNGYLISRRDNRLHTAFFKETMLQLDAYLAPAQEKKIFLQSRFLTGSDLYRARAESAEVAFELHKRLAQIYWHLVLVLLAFSYAMIMRRRALLQCIAYCGLSFLGSYVVISLAQSYLCQPPLCLLLLYGVPTAALGAAIVLLLMKGQNTP